MMVITNERISVLLVSALPPPWGGVSSLTEVMMRRGLPFPYEYRIVDTTIWPRRLFEPTPISVGEVKRILEILVKCFCELAFQKIKIMHFNFTPTRLSLPRDFLIVYLSGLFRVPVVIQIHGDLASIDFKGWIGIRRKLLSGIIKRSNCVLVLNKSTSEYISQFVQNAVTLYLPNFVESVELIPRKSGKIEFRHQQLMKVIFVGGVTPAKGIWELLHAILRTTGIDLLVVGQPVKDIKKEIEDFVKQNGINERVRIMGAKDREEVFELMMHSDVFCLPSYKEGLPISILEAMICEMPIVATAVGGIPDVVDEQLGGYLVPPRDVDALISALERIRDNPTIRIEMGKYNRKKAIENYEYSNVISMLTNVYSELLNTVS